MKSLSFDVLPDGFHKLAILCVDAKVQQTKKKCFCKLYLNGIPVPHAVCIEPAMLQQKTHRINKSCKSCLLLRGYMLKCTYNGVEKRGKERRRKGRKRGERRVSADHSVYAHNK